jgi:hypothetical protein
MSYNFDGKITNQKTKTFNYTSAKTTCSKCGKLIDAPKRLFVTLGDRAYAVRSYLDTPFFIYETKKGTSAAYCSDYCRKKHNHRFN